MLFHHTKYLNKRFPRGCLGQALLKVIEHSTGDFTSFLILFSVHRILNITGPVFGFFRGDTACYEAKG